MKSIFTSLVLIMFGLSTFGQTPLISDDFESYYQGPISVQNSAWTDITNASANVTWMGGTFAACTSSDNNQAYLSFEGFGIPITSEVGLNAVNGQVSVEVNVSMYSGYKISFFGDDIFYSDSYNDLSADYMMKYIINFETDSLAKYVNGTLINTTPIQANMNSLMKIRFSSTEGEFKLACITVTDITDLDGDGYYANQDCDDNNPNVHPGAVEITYNGLDDDCNSATPDDDLDGDGYLLAVDCNDNNPNVHPGAVEITYNGLDDDCNSATPDDDLDGDGYLLAVDCNDNNPNVHPGAVEITYNGLDDDCNSATLDNDLDNDGFPVPEDCDDNNPDINPNAVEIPDNDIDENCDGEISTTGVTNINRQQILLAPNPANNFIEVKNIQTQSKYVIYNMLGKVMQTSTSEIIDITNLSCGEYYLVCISNSQNITVKFIKN